MRESAGETWSVHPGCLCPGDRLGGWCFAVGQAAKNSQSGQPDVVAAGTHGKGTPSQSQERSLLFRTAATGSRMRRRNHRKLHTRQHDYTNQKGPPGGRALRLIRNLATMPGCPILWGAQAAVTFAARYGEDLRAGASDVTIRAEHGRRTLEQAVAQPTESHVAAAVGDGNLVGPARD